MLSVIFFGNCKKQAGNPIDIDLITPADNARVNINSLNFSWSGPAGDNFLIEIASDQFYTIVDSVTIHSMNYYSADTIPGSVCIQSCASNYSLGATYYWRVLASGSHPATSATRSFTINDQRSNVNGQWTGVFRSTYRVPQPPYNTDTTYTGTMNIVSNSDGTISATFPGSSSGEMYALSNTSYFYGHYEGGSAYEQQRILFDSTFQHLTYSYYFFHVATKIDSFTGSR
ncbi:MAG: hypothetical protein JWO06_2424 [Bacteroidota bacterium]|nr:hypothetical protein [Bacteroidota bacterium]